MTKRTLSELATYRGQMKRKLMDIGCQFDGGESTATLEEMMRVNNLEA